MAYRSGGHQVESIDFGAPEFICDSRGEFGADLALRVDAAHEAEARVEQFADDALALQLLEPFPRKHAIGVELRVPRRISEVPDIQIVAGRAFWYAPIGCVLAVEARLVAVHDAPGADKRDLALRDRFGQRRPGDGLVGYPAIWIVEVGI